MTATADRTDPAYLENDFRYAFSVHGEKAFRKLRPDEQKKTEETLAAFAEKTWHTIVQLPRQKGLTPERKGQSSYNKVLKRAHENHRDRTLYPFHLRVPTLNKKCRLFGYQHKETFYITQIDRNHSEHR